jgi:hypothetical protein
VHNAIHAETYSLHTPIHNLPVEIQEIILAYARPLACYNILDRTVYATRLNLGILFTFSPQNYPIVLRDLGRERELDPNKSEYQVLIWSIYVGLTYELEKGNRTSKLWDLLTVGT